MIIHNGMLVAIIYRCGKDMVCMCLLCSNIMHTCVAVFKIRSCKSFCKLTGREFSQDSGIILGCMFQDTQTESKGFFSYILPDQCKVAWRVLAIQLI